MKVKHVQMLLLMLSFALALTWAAGLDDHMNNITMAAFFLLMIGFFNSMLESRVTPAVNRVSQRPHQSPHHK